MADSFIDSNPSLLPATASLTVLCLRTVETSSGELTLLSDFCANGLSCRSACPRRVFCENSAQTGSHRLAGSEESVRGMGQKCSAVEAMANFTNYTGAASWFSQRRRHRKARAEGKTACRELISGNLFPLASGRYLAARSEEHGWIARNGQRYGKSPPPKRKPR